MREEDRINYSKQIKSAQQGVAGDRRKKVEAGVVSSGLDNHTLEETQEGGGLLSAASLP